MTIYYRLKVWTIKGWRMLKNAFKFVRPRTTQQIFMAPTLDICDYCDNQMMCVTLECDLEVYAKICAGCLDRARAVIMKAPEPPVQRSHRGVVIQ